MVFVLLDYEILDFIFIKAKLNNKISQKLVEKTTQFYEKSYYPIDKLPYRCLKLPFRRITLYTKYRSKNKLQLNLCYA